MENNTIWILVCIGLPAAGVLMFLWGFRKEQNTKRKTIEDAAAQYQLALTKLKASPDDPDALQEAWQLGESYVAVAQFTRKDPFKEADLMNDLNAILPTPTTLTSLNETAAEKEGPNSVARDLAKLEELKDKGLITEAEYHQQRLAIFDQI